MRSFSKNHSNECYYIKLKSRINTLFWLVYKEVVYKFCNRKIILTDKILVDILSDWLENKLYFVHLPRILGKLDMQFPVKVTFLGMVNLKPYIKCSDSNNKELEICLHGRAPRKQAVRFVVIYNGCEAKYNYYMYIENILKIY